MKLRRLGVALTIVSLLCSCTRTPSPNLQSSNPLRAPIGVHNVGKKYGEIALDVPFVGKENFLRLVDESLLKLAKKDSKTKTFKFLENFRNKLQVSSSEAELYDLLVAEKEYQVHITPDVLFTGYYRPLFKGSRTRSKNFTAPLYSKPKGIKNLPRKELLSSGLLTSHELIYLKDPFEAYLAEIQGSVGIVLESGEVVNYAFAGSNTLKYVSIGTELVSDNKLTKKEATIAGIRSFLERHPELRQTYINRNPRFVFFQKSKGKALGSSGVELLAERAVATDRNIYPLGTVLLAKVNIPSKNSKGEWEEQEFSKFVIALDCGSAIIGPKRIDLYLGEGDKVGDVAGRLNSRGDIWTFGLK